jgi:site-specific recombinase XerD
VFEVAICDIKLGWKEKTMKTRETKYQTIHIEPFEVNGVKYIRFKTEGDQEVLRHLKCLEGIIWDQRLDAFIIEDRKGVINRIFNHVRLRNWFLDYSKLKPDTKQLPGSRVESAPFRKPKLIIPEKFEIELKKFNTWMQQKRYAKNTINSYVGVLRIFFSFYKERDIENINKQDIEEYNYHYIICNGYSCTFQNQTINAIKLFYIKMLDIKHELNDLERPQRKRILPKVIAKNDIYERLSEIGNLKHKTALATIYGLGLRRSELINLKLSDINSKRKTVTIRNAKGGKDRVLPLPEKLLELLIRYYKVYKPVTWLIEGQDRNTPYSEGSLQNIFKKYFSGIDKMRNFTLHCLRHSYATHLLESGTDIRYIQELLGHKSSRTTEIYTYVSMRSLQHIKNPIDDFDL